MPQDDPIQEFIDLPRDQQMQTLQQLSPERQDALLGQVTQRKGKATAPAAAAATTPGTLKQRANAFMAERPIDKSQPNVSMGLPGMPEISSQTMQRAENFGRGALRGAATLIRHPYDTLIGSGIDQMRDFMPSYTTVGGVPIPIPNLPGTQNQMEQAKQAMEHPEYTAGQIAGQLAVTHGIAKLAGVGGLRAKAAQGVRSFAQENLGVGPEFAEKTAERYGKRATMADKKNEAIAQKNTDTSAKTQAKIAAQLQEEKAARLKVKKENKDAASTEQQKRGEVREHNEGVLREDRNRAATQEKHDTATKELDTRIKQAGVKAKAGNDANWKKWRTKVKGQETDSAPIAEAIKSQRSNMDPEDVAEFRKVLKESKPATEDMDEAERERGDIAQGQFHKPFDKLGDAEKEHVNRVLESMNLDPDEIEESAAQIPADRLHVWKTQLEQAVRKATRGNVRYAIGQVLDKVRDAEEQLSEAAGAESELKTARQSHREYSEAFVNPQHTPSTAANKTLSTTSSEYVQGENQAQRLARLGKFDPEIPTLVEHIGNLQEGLKALPDGPQRERFKEAPPKPEPTPVPKPAEATPPPKPQEPVPEAKAPNLTAERRKVLASNLRKYGRVGAWVGRLVIGGGAAALSHGDISKFGTDLLIGQTGLTVLTKALQSERVLDWLAKPSAEDLKAINSLPPDQAAKMRAALTGLAQEEIRKNPSLANKAIAPGLVAFMGTQTIQAAPANRKEALDRLGGDAQKKTDNSDFMVTQHPKGLVEPGNIPIWSRPSVENFDGSHSSEFSMSFTDDQGREVLVPTVVNGRFLTPDGKIPKTYKDPDSPEMKALGKAAWANYEKTGQNLGKFDNPDDADAYSQTLHSRGKKDSLSTPVSWDTTNPAGMEGIPTPVASFRPSGGPLRAPIHLKRNAARPNNPVLTSVPESEYIKDTDVSKVAGVPQFLKDSLGRMTVREQKIPQPDGQLAVAEVNPMAPQGIGIVRPDLYDRGVRAHELTHVLQMTRNSDWQAGMPDNRSYDYGDIEGLIEARKQRKTIGDFGVEQQAAIIGDYRDMTAYYLDKAKRGALTGKEARQFQQIKDVFHPFVKQLAGVPNQEDHDKWSLNPQMDTRPDAPGIPSADVSGILAADPLMSNERVGVPVRNRKEAMERLQIVR